MTQPLTMLYCPFPTVDAARVVATALLEARLVACCNLIPIAESLYWWEGKLAANPEIALIAKTSTALATHAQALLAEMHPYDCPAILTLDAHANAPFAAWVAEQTSMR